MFGNSVSDIEAVKAVSIGHSFLIGNESSLNVGLGGFFNLKEAVDYLLTKHKVESELDNAYFIKLI
jgi:hypothetical protein